jgi:hypothetical protein
VAGSCEYGDELSGSGATELMLVIDMITVTHAYTSVQIQKALGIT